MASKNKGQAVVVGSGIGGIAVALRLRAAGYSVDVFEKNEKPGGKLDEFSKDGFRWDMGPSLLTLPLMVEELFNLYGKNPSAYFSYKKLNIVCNYFFSDGLVIQGYNSPNRFAEEIHKKTGFAQGKVLKYLKHSEKIYKLTAPIFIFNSFHKLTMELLRNGIKALLNFPKLKSFKTMHKENLKQLQEPHLVQIFDRFATYNGSNPYQAPATLNVIPYLEHCLGAYFPDKGMYDIVNSLYKLAIEEGIQFYFGEPVIEVKHKDKKIKGVQTSKRDLECELVVSDSDIVPFYSLLSPEINIPERFLKYERSSSALIFYWAIDRSFPELDLHNILFSEDYKAEFDALFKTKSFFEDPTVYLFISKKQVETDAPEGKENWFVMINAPVNCGQDWDEVIFKYKEAIIRKINKYFNVKIENYILSEEILTPEMIEKKTSSFQGALYGPSSNSKWAAFRRHSNFSASIKGLYFVGGSVHPGGGIPLCLSSAQIVSSLIP